MRAEVHELSRRSAIIREGVAELKVLRQRKEEAEEGIEAKMKVLNAGLMCREPQATALVAATRLDR